MKSSVSFVLTLAVLVAGATNAVKVQGAPKKAFDQLFDKLDTNRDKKLSESEFIGKKTGEAKARAQKQFRDLDKDNDKSLLFKEYKKL